MKFANPSKKTRTVVSMKGHSLEFPGVSSDGFVFVHVPPALHQECIQAGLLPEEELQEEEVKPKTSEPEDPEARKAQVYTVFTDMVARGAREEFGANGAPKALAVSKYLGWDIQNAEMKDLWTTYQVDSKDD